MNRHLVMYNDFVADGPVSDPAGVKKAASASDAFRKMSDAGVMFVSALPPVRYGRPREKDVEGGRC